MVKVGGKVGAPKKLLNESKVKLDVMANNNSTLQLFSYEWGYGNGTPSIFPCFGCKAVDFKGLRVSRMYVLRGNLDAPILHRTFSGFCDHGDLNNFGVIWTRFKARSFGVEKNGFGLRSSAKQIPKKPLAFFKQGLNGPRSFTGRLLV